MAIRIPIMRKRTVRLVVVLGALLAAVVVLLSSCSGLRCALLTKHHSEHAGPRPEACSEWPADAEIDGMKVFAKGELGDPPVLLLHELPGLLPETVCFADELVKRHHRVYMPLFFGSFGAEAGKLRQLAVCAGPNFNCLSGHESRVVGKLEQLRDRIAAQHPDQKLAIIGMCLTGGMPLALVNDRVGAVVLSQPAIPLPLTESMSRSIGVDLKAHDFSKVHVLAIRFKKDCLVGEHRFDALPAVIPHFEPYVVPTTDETQHSVLTIESHNAEAAKAIQKVFDFLAKNAGSV